MSKVSRKSYLKRSVSLFSAGVGRTGAYIMIDAMLEQAKHQQSLDIFSYLQTIREDRPYMVQTEVSSSLQQNDQ